MKDIALLTIVLTTYNHPEYIEYYLSKCDYLDELNIILEIHDSSTNDETERTVNNYQQKYKNLLYYHYDDINIDLKTFLCLKRCQTKYVFLCGDGVILNANRVYGKIMSYMEQDYDIIEFYDDINKKHIQYYHNLEDKYNSSEIVYHNLKNHMLDNYWHMPYYGGTIVKSGIFKRIKQDDIQLLIGTGFIYPYMICAYTNIDANSVVLGGDYLIPNIKKKAAIWLNEKVAIAIWAKQFPEVINMLPDEFAEIRKKLIINSEKRLQFITIKGLCYLRVNNNYDIKIYKEYRKELVAYSPLNKAGLIAVAIFPKWILKLVRAIKNCGKKV
ncbi:MAG: hypothetical protein HFE42_02095 [Clostridia bacterium]|nr:hypothetical protein [Clostridia bacterium]